jgi:hypothetical protein
MALRCAECGYDKNAADYTFCGRCGATLHRSTSRVPRPASVAGADTLLSGPSFLGLAGPSTGADDSRVKESAPEPGPWRARLALMSLLATGLIFLLRHEGNSWRGLWDRRHELESSTGPIPSSNSSTETSAPVKNQNADVAQPPSLPAHGSGSVPGLAPPASTMSLDADNRKPDSAAPMPEPVEKPQQVSVRPPFHREQLRGSVVNTKQDELVTEGERYLYGNGVPQNCDRARTNLFVAAGQSNAEAQAALGAMFATGHCVVRDLPAAYRWFARAERKQSHNPRIEGDLRLLWKEMTLEEQNTAVRSTP